MTPDGALRTLATAALPGEDSDPIPRDVSTAQAFGPFPVGAEVRICCLLGDVWYMGGDEQVASKVASRGRGAPIVAGDFRTHTIMSEGKRYVGVVMDDDATEAYAVCFVTAQLEPRC